MAELSGSRSGGSELDIYTVLLGIAVVGLLLGVGFVWYRFTVLFETLNPFSVSQAVDAVRTTFLA